MSQSIEPPIPQGKYLPAVRNADLIYTSGMTPRKAGKLIYFGKIRSCDPIESHRDAIRLATQNALIAAQVRLMEGEHISAVLQLSVYLNADSDFTAHPEIADFASEFLMEQLGPESIGSRAAIGVTSLPSDATVEISLIAKVS